MCKVKSFPRPEMALATGAPLSQTLEYVFCRFHRKMMNYHLKFPYLLRAKIILIYLHPASLKIMKMALILFPVDEQIGTNLNSQENYNFGMTNVERRMNGELINTISSSQDAEMAEGMFAFLSTDQ